MLASMQKGGKVLVRSVVTVKAVTRTRTKRQKWGKNFAECFRARHESLRAIFVLSCLDVRTKWHEYFF
jgi:hypothetical protein